MSYQIFVQVCKLFQDEKYEEILNLFQIQTIEDLVKCPYYSEKNYLPWDENLKEIIFKSFQKKDSSL